MEAFFPPLLLFSFSVFALFLHVYAIYASSFISHSEQQHSFVFYPQWAYKTIFLFIFILLRCDIQKLKPEKRHNFRICERRRASINAIIRNLWNGISMWLAHTFEQIIDLIDSKWMTYIPEIHSVNAALYCICRFWAWRNHIGKSTLWFRWIFRANQCTNGTVFFGIDETENGRDHIWVLSFSKLETRDCVARTKCSKC